MIWLKETFFEYQHTVELKGMKATKSLSEDVVIGVSGTTKKGIIKQKMKERWQKQWYEERKGRWFYKIQRKTAEMR